MPEAAASPSGSRPPPPTTPELFTPSGPARRRRRRCRLFSTLAPLPTRPPPPPPPQPRLSGASSNHQTLRNKRLQPRRQETPPQLPGGPGGQITGGFSAIEQQPLRSFYNPPPLIWSFPAPRRAPPPVPSYWDAARPLAVLGLLSRSSITALPPTPAVPCTSVLSFPRLQYFHWASGTTFNWQGQLSIKHRPLSETQPFLTIYFIQSRLCYTSRTSGTNPACQP